MCAYQAKGELLLLKELNEEWPRHIQKIGRLLSREFSVLRDDRDRTARRHILQDRLK